MRILSPLKEKVRHSIRDMVAQTDLSGRGADGLAFAGLPRSRLLGCSQNKAQGLQWGRKSRSECEAE
jgi:hypothetical protein